MRRVLVGVDGSEAAGDALAWAGRLAARADAEVVVSYVVQFDEAELSPQRYDELLREAQHHLDNEWSDALRASGVAHRSVLLIGPPDALLEVADREDADLIVVGPRGRGGFAGLTIGSLAHHLAHATRRPLAIVPEPSGSASIDRIVVGVDGSEGSRAAIEWCADLAGRASSHVLAVFVFEPLAEWVLESDPRSWRTAAQRHLDTEWVEPLRAAGVAVETRIIEDVHPVAALAAAATDDDAGLLVVGTRGLSGAAGLRLGRIPIQLVHHTELPVVLVPPTASPPPG